MSSAPTNPIALLTADEFARRDDSGRPEELVRGRVVPLGVLDRRHGQICSKVGRPLGNFVEAHDLGHVLRNNAGVITERNPDTARGANIAFYSQNRLPRGPLPSSYGPELIVEVRSRTDRWPTLLAKVAEYLEAGVKMVIVLDPDPTQPAAHLFSDDQNRILKPDQDLTLPGILPGFSLPVRSFFEATGEEPLKFEIMQT